MAPSKRHREDGGRAVASDGERHEPTAALSARKFVRYTDTGMYVASAAGGGVVPAHRRTTRAQRTAHASGAAGLPAACELHVEITARTPWRAGRTGPRRGVPAHEHPGFRGPRYLANRPVPARAGVPTVSELACGREAGYGPRPPVQAVIARHRLRRPVLGAADRACPSPRPVMPRPADPVAGAPRRRTTIRVRGGGR
jgi:hypothetical protein